MAIEHASAAHQLRWAFYRIPAPARAAFRRRATDARCGEPAAVSAFAAVGIHHLMVATVELFDTVAAALASVPEDARPGAEAALFGHALPERAA